MVTTQVTYWLLSLAYLLVLVWELVVSPFSQVYLHHVGVRYFVVRFRRYGSVLTVLYCCTTSQLNFAAATCCWLDGSRGSQGARVSSSYRRFRTSHRTVSLVGSRVETGEGSFSVTGHQLGAWLLRYFKAEATSCTCCLMRLVSATAGIRELHVRTHLGFGQTVVPQGLLYIPVE